jgi:hypothetical protein
VIWLPFLALLWAVAPAAAQNTTCATRAPGDSSNACASTAFAHSISPGGYNIVSYGADPTGVSDSTSAIIATIAAAGSNPVYVPAGTFKITDQITLNSGQTLQCAGRTQSKLYAPATFNLAATAVISLGASGASSVPGSIFDCGISFYQDPAAASRAALITYPPAIYAGGGFASSQGRFQIDRVRVSASTKCLVATGENGGSYIGRFECGGFSTTGAIDIDGAADFIHMESVECWPYDFSTTAPLLALYTDQTTACMKLGDNDGVAIDKLATYAASVNVAAGAANGLPILINSLQIDGDGANFTNAGGAVIIGKLYTTKSASATTSTGFINISDGKTTIGEVHIIDGQTAGPGVHVTGGILQIEGGYWRHMNPANYGLDVTAGTAIVENTYIDPTGSGGSIQNRSAAFFFQNGASSALQLSNNTTPPSGGATGNFVVFNTDVAKNLNQNNNFGAWAIAYNATALGNYGLLYTASVWSALQTFNGGAFINTELTMRLYTIATLPTCNAARLGSLAVVADGTAYGVGGYGTAVVATGIVTRTVSCTNTAGATTYAWAYN